MQIACYSSSNLLHAKATANELGHLDYAHRGRSEVLVAFEGLRKAANFVVSFWIILSHQLSIPSRLGPAPSAHQEIAPVKVEPVGRAAPSGNELGAVF